MKNEQKIKPPVFETDMVKVWQREIRQAQFAIKYLQKKVRKVKAARMATALLLVAVSLSGCTSQPATLSLTPPMPPQPVVSPRLVQSASESVIVFTPKSAVTSITWKWDCNYQFTNEVTLIRASADLTKPQPLWECVFAGRTNTCTLPVESDHMYYRAENMITH